MDKILIQPEICDGCMDCKEACEGLYGASCIMIREVEGYYYPIICQHCEDAPCEKICPTEAMEKDHINHEKCIGCSLCMLICPFGSISMHDRKSYKCTQCTNEDMPACIKACSKRAIYIVNTEEMKLEKQTKHIHKIAGLKKKTKKDSGLVDILTHGTRAKDALK